MNVSEVVIGTWSLSGDFGPVGLSVIKDVLEVSRNEGFREFDTAPAYGNGFMEFCLGNIFAGCKDVLINTKVGNLPFGGKCFDLPVVQRSVDESLKRLGGLPINVLFLHNPRDEVQNYEPILGFMRDLKKQGLIKAIGLSMAKGYAYKTKVDLNEFDVIQNDLNLLHLDPLSSLDRPHPLFMARSPLASGLLSGRINAETVFQPGDHRSEWLKGERLKSLAKRVDAIKRLAGAMDLSTLAKKFVLSNDKIDKVIFGVKSVAHVHELVNDLQQEPLDEGLAAKLIELYNNDFGLINERQYRY